MGILLLIHPHTGDVISVHKGEGDIGRAAILNGYNPIGPKGQDAAEKIRAAAQPTK